MNSQLNDNEDAGDSIESKVDGELANREFELSESSLIDKAEIESELAEHIEGLLSPARSAELEKALAASAELNESLLELCQFEIDELCDQPVPEGLSDLVLARLEVEGLVSVHDKSAGDLPEELGYSAKSTPFADRILSRLSELDLVEDDNSDAVCVQDVQRVHDHEVAVREIALDATARVALVNVENSTDSSGTAQRLFFIFSVLSILALCGACAHLLQSKKQLSLEKFRSQQINRQLRDQFQHETSAETLRFEQARLRLTAKLEEIKKTQDALIAENTSLRLQLAQAKTPVTVERDSGAQILATALNSLSNSKEQQLLSLQEELNTVREESRNRQKSLETLSEDVLRQRSIIEDLNSKLSMLKNDLNPGFLVSQSTGLRIWDSQLLSWGDVKRLQRIKPGSLVKTESYNAEIELGQRRFRPPPGVYLVTERGQLVIVPKGRSQVTPVGNSDRDKGKPRDSENESGGLSAQTSRIIGRILGG